MRRHRFILSSMALAAAPLLSAQAGSQTSPPRPSPDYSKVAIRVERIAPGVAVLFGQGGNIGVSYGPDGTVLIDDQFAPLTDKISAALRSLDNGPVKFLINTHLHPDHTGGNENLGKAGAVIIAQENVRTRMSVEQFNRILDRLVPASPKAALPVITFTENLTVHMNDEDLQIIHVPHAHTDGDALIYFPKAKVLHTGDTFVAGLPLIDVGAGGSIDGLIAAGKTALSIVPEDVKIIRGHGPVASKAELRAFVAMLEEIRAKVRAEKRKGRSLAEIQVLKMADAYALPGARPASGFIQQVFETLPSPRR